MARDLIIGVEVRRGANRVLRDLAPDHGVLALPVGRTLVRLLSPLVVEQHYVDRVVAALNEVLD